MGCGGSVPTPRSIRLERLSPGQIAVGSIISIIGKRGTGKTLMLRALTYKLRDKIDFCIAMTPTTSSAEALAKVMPRQCIYDQGLNLDVIDRLMDTQTDNAARGSRVFSVLLILDDVSWDAASFKRPAPTLSKLYRNGRHMRITVMANPDLPSFRLVNDVFWKFAEREVVPQKERSNATKKGGVK
eukprot:2138846-Prymnesium_polylepis.1